MSRKEEERLALRERNFYQLKKMIEVESVRKSYEKALGNKEQASLFMASIIEIVSLNNGLKECNPKDIIAECLKAATLRLPVNRNLGYAWIIPYKRKGVPTPQFQMGYKGLVQLALRTGLYKYLNAGPLFEGEEAIEDRLYGTITITGQPESDEPIGYFAAFKLKSGFEKSCYWSKEKVIQHARRYSKSWGMKDSAWVTAFDAMASKTVLTHLLDKWGLFSVSFLFSGVDINDDEKRIFTGTELAQEIGTPVVKLGASEEPKEEPKEDKEKKQKQQEQPTPPEPETTPLAPEAEPAQGPPVDMPPAPPVEDGEAPESAAKEPDEVIMGEDGFEVELDF